MSERSTGAPAASQALLDTIVDRRTLLGGLVGAANWNTAPAATAPAATAPAAWLTPGTFEGSACLTLSNGALELTFLPQGASMASVVLRDDPDRLSPLWNSVQMNRDRGRDAAPSTTTGHLVCVDGFGPPSAEERKAGMPMHGEAHLQAFDVRSSKTGPLAQVTLSATLPLAQETLTRTLRAVDGENVISVESRLDSLLGFDRPVSWVEHATVGPPFAEPDVTVFDLSGTRCRSNASTSSDVRLAPNQEFSWPLARGADGGAVDLRQVPGTQLTDEFVTILMDPSRALVWTTALNPKRKLLLGYLIRREDYPWMLSWGSYATAKKPVRGMEFGMSPAARHQAVTMAMLFDVPTFRWLPARGSLTTRFLMFYTRVPDDFQKVDDVRMEDGLILIEDRAAATMVRLPTTLSL